MLLTLVCRFYDHDMAYSCAFLCELLRSCEYSCDCCLSKVHTKHAFGSSEEAPGRRGLKIADRVAVTAAMQWSCIES